jgi:ubiquinone/menaquinone biosynthesis C-methylase UbiE
MQEIYSKFAKFYDILTDNVDYKQRGEYFDKIIKKYNQTDNNILLDLACGTGRLSEEMSLKGYDVIGVDYSQEMLMEAIEKKIEKNLPIQYLCQDMREIDMFGTIGITICALDSLNHLENPEDIQKTFNKVSLFAEPCGLFIFDMNTVYKHKEVLGNNTFVYDMEEVYCVWENTYEEENNRVTVSLDFFEKSGNAYYRTSEEFCETAYETEKIAQMLKKADFELLEMFKGDTFNSPDEKTERIVYVARKNRSEK